ncbi:MAG: hypothetical protein ACFBSG_00755 [Leptolyngbyaceae cyanobacterium]
MQTIFTRLGKFLRSTQLRRAIAAGFVAVLLLTVQIADANVDASTQNRLDQLEDLGENGRPRTTGQFREDKEALKGQPGKVIKQMGRNTADAFGKANEMVEQTIKDVTPGLDYDGDLPQDK